MVSGEELSPDTVFEQTGIRRGSNDDGGRLPISFDGEKIVLTKATDREPDEGSELKKWVSVSA